MLKGRKSIFKGPLRPLNMKEPILKYGSFLIPICLVREFRNDSHIPTAS